MGNSNYFDELIVSYLSGELIPEEETFVLEWINSSEGNKQHFEALRSTWNLLAAEQTVKDLDVDQEWNRFKQSVSAEPVELLPIKLQTPVAHKIEEVAMRSSKGTWRQLMMATAVAASLIFIVALGWKVYYSSRPAMGSVPLTVSAKVGSKISIIRQVNTTDTVRLITLPDATQVTLYSKSEVSYNDHFNETRREIALLGKAHFKVAKDKTRPFTVSSGDISTTALGTQFTVTAYAKARTIAVRLYEGKVVVKSTDAARSKLNNQFFLIPGQELIYDNRYLTARVKSYRVKNNLAAKDNIKKEINTSDNLTIPTGHKGSWYMFNNQPLSQVFSQLEGMYNVEIVYPKQALSKIYFIGTFNVTDSLDEILKQIALVNNFTVTKKKNSIIITQNF